MCNRKAKTRTTSETRIIAGISFGAIDDYLRSVAAISLATCRARTRSPGPKDIAATRACPPPPFFSQSEARLISGGTSFHGFVPTDTFARVGDALTPTEKSASGYRKYGMNLL